MKNFIIESINYLSEQFPSVTFTYGYDSIGRQHLINVDKDRIYESEHFKLSESDIISAFIDQFPTEQLLFINNDTFIEIKNPIYVKRGTLENKVDYQNNYILPGKIGAFEHTRIVAEPLSQYYTKILIDQADTFSTNGDFNTLLENHNLNYYSVYVFRNLDISDHANESYPAVNYDDLLDFLIKSSDTHYNTIFSNILDSKKRKTAWYKKLYTTVLKRTATSQKSTIIAKLSEDEFTHIPHDYNSAA